MFKLARIKLTGWYLLILCFVSFFFSFSIYRFLTNEIDRFASIQRFRLEKRFPDRQDIVSLPPGEPPRIFIDPDLVADTKNRIAYVLIAVNGFILTVSGLLSYFLSGVTLKPIKKMIDEQNRFISDASHELRTPLTALKTGTEIALRNENLSLKETKQVLVENLSDVDRLVSLSNSLLEISKYEKPQAVKFKMISLRKAILAAKYAVRVSSKDKNIVIKTRTGSSLIQGNYEKLTELFVILLDNAIKFSQKESVVNVNVSKSKKFVKVIVSDTGVGIDEKDIPHIFERFFRSDLSRSAHPGFGLGLSIAKQIIDAHNANVKVNSVLGKGTSFEITFPLQKV